MSYLEVAKRTKGSEDRGLKVRFSLATIAFDRESAQMSQILSSQGKNAPSNPYPHYLVRLATSRNEGSFFVPAKVTLSDSQKVREAPDTFNFLRHVMRANLSV